MIEQDFYYFSPSTFQLTFILQDNNFPYKSAEMVYEYSTSDYGKFSLLDRKNESTFPSGRRLVL